MFVAKNDALKFGERRAAAAITSQTTETMASLLGAAGNVLPADVKKMLPFAQFALDGSWSKLMSGNGDAVNAALGMVAKFLPPELAKLAGTAQPLLTKGLESLASGQGLSGLNSMMSLDGLMGLAGQFMPPWAGDALAVGKDLLKGGIGGALDSTLSKYLPPELKAVSDAIKNLPGGWNQFLTDLSNNPKEPQGANGLWAARITDLVKCDKGPSFISSGFPTVYIGGLFAARATDTVSCNKVEIADVITDGEKTILIGGHFASRFYAGMKGPRIGDFTEHQGQIFTGFPTVHLGTHLGQCEACLTAAAGSGGGAGSAGAGVAGSGAATISGAGISPVGEGLLGDVAAGLGDMAKNKIADFAQQKAGELAGKVFGSKDKEIYDGSNFNNPGKQNVMESGIPKPKSEIPKPQPKIHDDDDDFAVTKRN